MLVDPLDPVAVANATIALMRDPLLRRRLGMAARQAALQHFSTGQVVEATLSVYQSLHAVERSSK